MADEQADDVAAAAAETSVKSEEASLQSLFAAWTRSFVTNGERTWTAHVFGCRRLGFFTQRPPVRL